VRIEPCVPGAGASARVRVAEGCPSSVLHAYGWPRRGYKGGGEPPRAQRAAILERLRGTGMQVPEPIAAEAIRDEEGDLLDALVLATPPFASAPSAAAMAGEGWVY
jgi:hypothetical protein